MRGKELELNLKKLASLGCGFKVDYLDLASDPEQTIIDSLNFFWTDEKLFIMLIGVLKHRISDLIHVERLVSLAKKLSNDELIILMVIADKMVRLGDRRFKLVEQKLKRRGMKLSKSPNKLYSGKYLLDKWGLDPSFKKYKIIVPKLFEEAEKKFFNRKHILENNPWLRIRALVGSNYRADLIYLKSANIVDSPAKAYKIVGCERSTAYKIWDSISEVGNLEKLIA